MGTGTPPNPMLFRTTQEWAIEFYDFFMSQTRVREENEPLPLLLAHKVKGIMARAATNGIIMYNPATGHVELSTNKKWAPMANLTLDLAPVFPAYTATEIADATSDANTVGKTEGKTVYDSTNTRLMVAVGDQATDNWAVADGSATVTPS